MISDVSEYISSLKNSRKFGPQVVCHKTYPQQDAEYCLNFPPLDPSLKKCLKDLGISRLYSHQGEAIEKILLGDDIVVATPTASGKSIIYNLPVANDLFSSHPGHSLYLFPLKALAHDQYKVVTELFSHLPDVIQRNERNFASRSNYH